MITTINLINKSVTSHSYLCVYFSVVRTFKSYSPRKFQVYNTLLTRVTILYIGSPELTLQA